MADVSQTKLGDLFPKSVFEIPRYQRGYAWTETQVNDLLEDIEYTLEERMSDEDENFTHYFGTVVLLKKGTKDSESRDFEAFDIIDGQQRMVTVAILMNCVNNQLEALDESKLNEEYSASPSRLAEENRSDFIRQYDTERIVLDNINDRVFQSLVIHNEPIDSIQTENVSQRRLINAKQEIQDWLGVKAEELTATDTQDDYFDFLREVQKIIKSGLEVTAYEIEDETEAGRLFEVINDRGKDLTSLDKIKSYLVYCSARYNDNDLSLFIYRKIGEVIENITKYGEGDNEIESFVSYHWMLFSGELILARQSDSEYTTVHRRIKHLEKHAALKQPEDSVRGWINQYLDSLLECSEAYKEIKHPEEISTDFERVDEIREDLDGLNRLPVSNNFLPLLMATHHQFGISEAFRRIVSLCEKLSFRVYNVAGRRTDAGRAALQRHGYWIEWAGRRQMADSTFDGQHASLKFDTVKEAIPSTCKRIESEIGENCPDTYFVDCLLRDDIFDGTDRNDGWTGVRNKDVISYLLYKYEKHLRMKNSRDDLSQIPSFTQWKREGVTIEHIHPQSPTDSDGGLDEIIDTLGNLVLLGPKDNAGVGNRSYEQKHERVYADSSMMMISKLPTPADGWTKQKAWDRAREIVRFAVQEWGELSTAHVHVSDAPSDISSTELRDIAHGIRRYHREKQGFTIPSVHIQEEGARGHGWKIMNSCSICDSTRVNLTAVDEWKATCGGCGSELENPVYKFKESDYLKPLS